MMWDVQEHRSKADEYARLADAAASPERREHFLRMAHTSLLMARNAEWIKSNDEFLRVWRRH
jgi:hypothetical protein